jgi:hypothetical protein
MHRPGVSGELSIKDIIAHITWYERETLGILQQRAVIGSELCNMPLDARNAAILAASRERTLDDIRAEAICVFDELLAAIQALAEEDLHDHTRFDRMPAEWIPWHAIASNTYEHYPQHIADITFWLAHQPE